jgi:hypothetical protein
MPQRARTRRQTDQPATSTEAQRGRLARSRRRRRPLRQGDLDRLCGVYAVVNALRFLCPELTGSGCGVLFRHLMAGLAEPKQKRTVLVADGLRRRTLHGLVEHGLSRARKDLRVDLVARLLPRAERTTDRFDRLWAALAKAVGESCVAIIELGGTQRHWTVVVRVGRKNLYFFDSVAITRVSRAYCGIDPTKAVIAIPPRSVILIERQS